MGVSDRRAREFKRRERDILDAAHALFCEMPWDSVTVSQIAERAEVGKGTVYKHFSSKDELFGHIFLEHQRALHWRFKRALGGEERVVPRLRRIVHLMWEANLEDPEFSRQLMSQAERPGIMDAFSRELVGEIGAVQGAMAQLYIEPISRGIQSGVFRDLGLQSMLLSASCTIQGALRMALAPYPPPGLDSAHVDRLVDYILRGFGCADDDLYP